MQYFLAGGAIRNLLLGLAPKDYDWAFACSAQEFLALNPSARKLGNKTFTYILGGAEYSELRGGTPATDILDRDFTINAFLLAPEGLLHMHPQSLQDLRDKIIRPVRPGALLADPLRVFRAARFAAAFDGFSLATETFEQMREAAQSPAFAALSAERVGSELRKALAGPKPGNFLRILNQAGCLAPWFAELENSDSIPAGPAAFHKSSVLEHIATVMDACAAQLPDYPELDPSLGPLAVWMALAHDLGKVNTQAGILPHHYGHEARGQELLPGLFKRLRLPGNFLKAGLLAAKHHMKAGRYEIHRPGVKVDMLTELHNAGLVLPFLLLCQADSNRKDLLDVALEDLKVILQVHLPEDKTGLGAASGQALRDLRCVRLANWLKENRVKET